LFLYYLLFLINRKYFHILIIYMFFSLCYLDTRASELRLSTAIQQSLKQNPDIQIQNTQIAVAQGQYLQAAGQFDWVLSSGLLYDKKVTPQVNSADGLLINSGYQLGMSKQLHNGMSLNGSLDALASDGQLLQQNRLKFDLSLIVPLLHGRDATASSEDVAKLNIELSRYQLRDRIAQTLYNTLLAYWTYRSRVDLEKVAQSSEERSQSLLRSIQKLVDAGEKPRADLVLLQADHSDKISRRQAAALARIEARTVLGRLLGLDELAIRQLPEPSDTLPAQLTTLPLFSTAAISTAALQQRPDVRALAVQLDAARRQMQAVQERLKPQLDLQLGLGYAKASEGGSRYGFAAEAGQIQASPSVFARLNYQFPLQNNSASGAMQERSALLSQLLIRQKDLNIGVASGVESAWQALFNSSEQLKEAKQALAWYELAVSQEVVKQKNGISTLIDVINVETRFVSARVNYLQLQLAYASALAKLRFETGTLLPAASSNIHDDEVVSLDVSDMAGLGPLTSFH
jgi:outer membrane protein